MGTKKGLFIIDMQQGSFTPETPRHDTEGTIKRINELAEIFRHKDWPVIFVQHDGSKEGVFIPNSEDWKILPDLMVCDQDLLQSKIANDIFYQTDLHHKLQNLGVDELFITGCATDFCVEASIQSALTKDYNIVVVKDGHTTGRRPHLSAEKVIEHYNWTWENMIPTKGTIRVLDTETLKNSILRE